VPDNAPDDASVSPGGGLPDATDQLRGSVPPVAVKLNEYGVPTFPPGGAPEVIVRGAVAWLTTSVTATLGVLDPPGTLRVIEPA
jgi:hypothetical protein